MYIEYPRRYNDAGMYAIWRATMVRLCGFSSDQLRYTPFFFLPGNSCFTWNLRLEHAPQQTKNKTMAPFMGIIVRCGVTPAITESSKGQTALLIGIQSNCKYAWCECLPLHSSRRTRFVALRRTIQSALKKNKLFHEMENNTNWTIKKIWYVYKIDVDVVKQKQKN